MLEKINRMNDLFDAYDSLLTAKQKVYFELYYQADLSLAEIAGQLEVSRNAVFDNIKRTEKMLENYEEKLNLVAKRMTRQQLLDEIQQRVQDEYIQELIEQLQDLE